MKLLKETEDERALPLSPLGTVESGIFFLDCIVNSAPTSSEAKEGREGRGRLESDVELLKSIVEPFLPLPVEFSKNSCEMSLSTMSTYYVRIYGPING